METEAFAPVQAQCPSVYGNDRSVRLEWVVRWGGGVTPIEAVGGGMESGGCGGETWKGDNF